MDEPGIVEAEVEPRFLLFGPVGSVFMDELPAVLDLLSPAALVLRQGSIADDARLIDDIKQLAREHGFALLAEDDLDLAFDLDGIHLTDVNQVSTVRWGFTREQPMDSDRSERSLLGADAGFSRHDAMVAGEEGADYVAFGERTGPVDEAVIELITWWRELFVLPCLGYANAPESAATLTRAGADFIGVSSAIWDYSDGPATAALDLKAAAEKT